ncbi:hypothetical protein LGW51_08240 [Streptococcus mutans]|uniref:hypothetical protein n=1 Tax=Streptococcus mutans TaxID=1309 RepID=UPI0003C41A70|nr:hypothetical protein [Streptococcus mutans]ESS16288.1 hypothetical protein PLG01_01654 [Streptococcus mutans PKUSS-LG01]MCB4937152.1 hypothetical protein [Streptococcus mutans]MCB4964745.1 hypothetical protein [Streptococcus mutans]MCB5042589.1 hypothetical protein [Streptococcus mutans]MCB5059354.1 hypothetical protein [Streptococcus mutans]
MWYKISFDFLNSQFISSLFGALVGGGIAIYVAKLQNKQQVEQLKQEHELQQEYFSKQEENERERIFLKYTIERAEESYKILGDLRSLQTFFSDSFLQLIKFLPRDKNEIEDKEYKYIFLQFRADYLEAKYREFINLRDELLRTIIIQDNVKLSLLKEEILKEVQTFTKYYKRLLESQTLENFQKVTDEFEKQSLIMKSCDEFRTELTKYITQTTLRLVSEEKIVKKIKEQMKQEGIWKEEYGNTK